MRLYLLASSQVWLPKRFDQEHDPGRGGQVLQHAPEQLRLLRALRRRLDARRRARRGRAAAGRSLAAEPARRDGRGGGARRGPSTTPPPASARSWISWWTTSPMVRARQPVAVLGRRTARPIRRRSRRCTRRWSTVSRLLAPGRAVRQRLAAPGPDGNLGAPRPVSGDRGPPGRRARGGHGRGAPARVAGARRARRTRKLPVRQPLARMQVAVPAAVRGPGVRRAARAAAARGEREGGRGGRLRRRSGPAPGQAQFPLAGQALRQADAGDRGGRGRPHGRAAPRARAGPDRPRSRSTASRRPSCPRTWWSSAR